MHVTTEPVNLDVVLAHSCLNFSKSSRALTQFRNQDPDVKTKTWQNPGFSHLLTHQLWTIFFQTRGDRVSLRFQVMLRAMVLSRKPTPHANADMHFFNVREIVKTQLYQNSTQFAREIGKTENSNGRKTLRTWMGADFSKFNKLHRGSFFQLNRSTGIRICMFVVTRARSWGNVKLDFHAEPQQLTGHHERHEEEFPRRKARTCTTLLVMNSFASIENYNLRKPRWEFFGKSYHEGRSIGDPSSFQFRE
jgi:hypothetical protein